LDRYFSSRTSMESRGSGSIICSGWKFWEQLKSRLSWVQDSNGLCNLKKSLCFLLYIRHTYSLDLGEISWCGSSYVQKESERETVIAKNYRCEVRMLMS
jgi:hypothetical protein